MKRYSQYKILAATVALGFVSLSAQAAPPPPPPVPAAGEEDILDIRPPIHIAAPFPWLAGVAGTLGAAALGLAAWNLMRRKGRKLPYEITLERLENTRSLMHENDAEPFCLAVSEVVREFIEEVLPVHAVDRTTDEFLRDLARVTDLPLPPHRETLAHFLWHCDLAKFALWSLTIPEMEAMLQSAKEFVVDLGKPTRAKIAPSPAANAIVANSYSLIT